MNKNEWQILTTNYINNGLRIFPVVENGKTPLIKSWQKECSSDFMQILYWMEKAKNCNWGLPASQNNLFIIDLDVHDPMKNGVENFDKLSSELGLCGAETLVQQTPSGGLHIIYESDEELQKVSNGSNVFKNYPGIDFRTDGYIVVEPSWIDNKQYKFQNNLKPSKMPKQLKQYILDNCMTKEKQKKATYEKPKEVSVGDRDNQLFQYINQLYFKTRLDFDEILLLANHFNENVLEKPFSEKDVAYKVKKSFEKERNRCLFIILGEE